MEEKILTFEYFVYQLINKHKEDNNDKIENDFSTLKVLKLLFFCTAVNSSKDVDDSLFDNPFNNFFAMPYGHVESDIYNAIRSNQLNFYSIDNNQTKEISSPVFLGLNENIKVKIEKSFELLLKENPSILKMNSFELVELSHLWYSWKFYFNKAKKNGINSQSIPISVLKTEEKVFFLN